MDLDSLYGGSYVNWAGVAESWAKRTVSSRLLVFAARRHLRDAGAAGEGREVPAAMPETLPKEVLRAYGSPPEPDASGSWGAFLDAALAAEFELLPYGERPPVIAELRQGLSTAEKEAGEGTRLGLWFRARREALPGHDLPDGAGYLPV
ncbi:hypothetical protein [Rubrobacter indicoceani]|uniref:hypothetical protein n=1 Tax=Rubrobacter indicoceani TaxID=2051957 RepID=UPI000E5B436A|nr:hypothetical protein [Rubrobacter indicoceani]